MGRILRRSSRRALTATLSLTASLALMAGAAPELHSSPRTPRPEPTPTRARVAYPHGSVLRTEFGTGAKSYWLFEPDDPKPSLHA